MEKSTHTPEYAILLKSLRKLRESSGHSQRSLATAVNVPHSWVAKVESGERRIDVVELCRVIAACGANPVEFIPEFIENAGLALAPKSRKRGSSK